MSVDTGQSAAAPSAVSPSPAAGGLNARVGTRRTSVWIGHATTWGVLIVFALIFAYFSVLITDTFFTGSNMASILNSAVIDGLLAAGITFPLIMNDFDLSIGSTASLSGALAVVMLSEHNWTTVSAVILALAVAVLIGLINGFLVAVLKASSFIVTLAMGSVLTGLEFWLTKQRTIIEAIPASYTRIGSAQLGDVILPVFIVIGLVLIGGATLSQTVLGRSIYAVGSNMEASRIAGVRTVRLRVIGFVISALTAGLAGIFITSIATSSFPSAGNPHLLPAFAGAFLGSVLFPHRRFSVVGSALAAVLLEMVSTGLVESNYASWTTYVFNGVVLLLAVLVALRTRRQAAAR